MKKLLLIFTIFTVFYTKTSQIFQPAQIPQPYNCFLKCIKRFIKGKAYKNNYGIESFFFKNLYEKYIFGSKEEKKDIENSLYLDDKKIIQELKIYTALVEKYKNYINGNSNKELNTEHIKKQFGSDFLNEYILYINSLQNLELERKAIKKIQEATKNKIIAGKKDNFKNFLKSLKYFFNIPNNNNNNIIIDLIEYPENKEFLIKQQEDIFFL